MVTLRFVAWTCVSYGDETQQPVKLGHLIKSTSV